jgi:two-component system, response regulator PdtaR
MAQFAPPRRRALIVEDEFMIALDLQDAMSALDFDVCGLAPTDRKARSLAMREEPDIALVDVCLEGGREGIETARWLREVLEHP